jgi:hypothetical protein
MFDIVSDYNSATSSDMMAGYAVFESNKRFFSEMCFSDKTSVSVLSAQDYL